MSNNAIATKKDTIKAKIIRALCCAVGEHEPWERYDNCGYKCSRPVHGNIQTDMHGELYVAVCKFCRTVYVRKRDE